MESIPLCYNQTLCHFNAFICIFSSEVCLHHRQFSSFSHLPHTSLLQGLEGFPTGSALPEPGDKDSVRSFHHLMGSDQKWILLLQAGHEVCLAYFLGNHVPHLAAGFSSSPAVGSSSSCWQPAHLTSSTLFAQWRQLPCPTTTLYSPILMPCLSCLAIGPICEASCLNCSYTSLHFLCST